MKKGAIILCVGLLAGICAFTGFYQLRTAPHRRMMRESQPELAWLKTEFNLSDGEFTRIQRLHDAYLPDCAERCRRIEQQNQRLRDLMGGSTNMTSDIRAVLAERARLRGECETEMLKHFLEVSRAMPPEQGRRYLAWIEDQTFLQGWAMERRHKQEQDPHAAHPH